MMTLAIQILKFLAVGTLNTLLGLMAIYAVMYFTDFGPLTANAVGYGIGLIVSFTLNRTWTFQNNAPTTNSLPKYLLAAAAAYTINVGAVLTSLYTLKLNPYIAQLTGIVFYTATMFLACRLIIFKPTV